MLQAIEFHPPLSHCKKGWASLPMPRCQLYRVAGVEVSGPLLLLVGTRPF